ncbi:hypothetical protein [Microbulbifer sp. SAOS-129_SWC]|uniref:hypothetical protein n=1 Tax=Microbulbifer sp. SAOS-129_SWC TaxID=3145235 RepID=UPI00321736FF
MNKSKGILAAIGAALSGLSGPALPRQPQAVIRNGAHIPRSQLNRSKYSPVQCDRDRARRRQEVACG